MGNETRSASTERRVDLDWIRIAAFGFLILYHVGMVYVPWWYHVKSTRIDGLVPLMNVLSPWRLSLLFVVSGAATRFMADRLNPGSLAIGRTLRLLPPLIFGMLVVVAPQSYFQVVEQRGYTGSFGEFYWSHYLAFGKEFCSTGPCIILPTWNHLWFVAYIWNYSLLLAALLWLTPGVVRGVERVSSRWLSGVGVLVCPVLLVGLYRFLLLERFPENTNGLLDDPLNHLISFTMFLFGFLFARDEGVWGSIVRWRWVVLILALVAYATNALGPNFSFMFDSHLKLQPAFNVDVTAIERGSGAWWVWHVYRMWCYPLYKWGCIVTALGFGRLYLTRDSRVRRYLTDAIFPYYIVHQTVIIAAVHWLKPAALPTWLEASIVIATTVISCALVYEIVRRVRWLRPWFGLKRLLPEPGNGGAGRWLVREDA